MNVTHLIYIYILITILYVVYTRILLISHELEAKLVGSENVAVRAPVRAFVWLYPDFKVRTSDMYIHKKHINLDKLSTTSIAFLLNCNLYFRRNRLYPNFQNK